MNSVSRLICILAIFLACPIAKTHARPTIFSPAPCDLNAAVELDANIRPGDRTYLVYYANETDPASVDRLAKWLATSEKPEHKKATTSMLEDAKKFPTIVSGEITELIKGAAADPKLGLIVFTNSMAKRGLFRFMDCDDREPTLAEWSVFQSQLRVFQAHPLAHPRSFELAMRAVSERLTKSKAASSDFVLIAKSHGSQKLAIAQSYAPLHESNSANELFAAMASLKEAADQSEQGKTLVKSSHQVAFDQRLHAEGVSSFDLGDKFGTQAVVAGDTTNTLSANGDSANGTLSANGDSANSTLGVKNGAKFLVSGTTKNQFLTSISNAREMGIRFHTVFMEACQSELPQSTLEQVRQKKNGNIGRLFTSNASGLRYQTIDYAKLFGKTRRDRRAGESSRFAELFSDELGKIAQVHFQDGLPSEENETRDFEVIAHRGASGYLPEHTLEAYALAYGMGADFIEQDVVLTKDNQAIVLHDIHLDTVTNVAELFPNRKRDDGRYYAIDLTLAEIKTLSVHERCNHETGKAVFDSRFPKGKSSFRIPTLTEAIELIQGLNLASGKNVGIYPEIKKPRWHRDQDADISPIVLQTLQQAGYKTKHDSVYLQCFDPVELRRIREELDCPLRLVQLIGSNEWNEATVDYNTLVTADGLQTIAEYADGIGPWMPYIITGRDAAGSLNKTKLVPMAHRNNLVVHPFTFRSDSLPDYAADFGELVRIFRNAGVDGVFTDQTDKALLARRDDDSPMSQKTKSSSPERDTAQVPAVHDSTAKFRYISAEVGDDFAFLRCESKTGQVWSHNESGQWKLLTKGEATKPGDYSCAIAPYTVGGGRSPLASGVAPITETWAVFRIDQRTGKSWIYSDGTFKKIDSTAKEAEASSGEYRLICEAVGDHFAIYRYNTRTAVIWQYVDSKWVQIATEDLPASTYGYKIVSTKRGNEHLLFRFDLATGQAWNQTADGFVPVEISK